MRITQSSDITPAILTDILIACGVLRAGTVTTVACDMESSQKGFISNVATFNVTYSRNAGDDLPQRFFLKVTKSDLHPEYRHPDWAVSASHAGRRDLVWNGAERGGIQRSGMR